MTIRTRLTLASAVLLVGTVTSACGGGSGAPTDASRDGFCEAANSLLADLVPEDTGTTPEMPSDEDMAEAVKDWGAEMEEVGTPEDISDDARAGFEVVVDQAQDIDASDFSAENLEELGQGGADASQEEQDQADAFGDYLTETCGNPMDDIEVPELESPETTE